MGYQHYHRNLLEILLSNIRQLTPFNSDNFSEQDHAFLHNFERLVSQPSDEAFFELGQQLLCQIVAAYPHITPQIPRDLLWYFSGDCLHFLNDDEIALYTHLDELRYEAESEGREFNIAEERAKLKKLH